MTLEFEKITDDLDKMATSSLQRERESRRRLDEALLKLRRYAQAWTRIDRALDLALSQVNRSFYRAARPLNRRHPLDQPVPVPDCPPEATIVAVDGSQILPNRHAPFLYYLINVGVFVYEHGRGQPPQAFTAPTLDYPRETELDDEEEAVEDSFGPGAAAVGVQRDLAEIGALADMVWQRRQGTQPLLALLDQRLLYWPVGGGGLAAIRQANQRWLLAMSKIRDGGGLLAGYIDRPGKRSVMSLLDTLDIAEPGFDLDLLTRRALWQTPTDVDLFGSLLAPGERSPLFVEISHHNVRFAEHSPDHEVCFFYLNPAASGRHIARVDIPRWVAEDDAAVDAVHALLVDQCQILGGYPYALTRADEVAVVGRQDQEELNHRIALRMEAAGLSGTITNKQQAKEFARSGRQRWGE